MHLGAIDLEDDDGEVPQPMSCTRIAVYVVAGILLIVLLGLVGWAIYWATQDDHISEVFEAIAKMGFWGYLLMGFIIALLNFPLTFAYLPTCTLCGFMYGMGKGLLIVVVGTAIGMQLVFILFRYFIRRKGALVCHEHIGDPHPRQTPASSTCVTRASIMTRCA
jgi:uncharacterized membrane protein YdjX (TVP38/TMEM64 family)